MAGEQVIPITGLNTVGLIKDSPAVSLPPNAFTDVLNVRFHNGAVNKVPGDRVIASATDLGLPQGSQIVHMAYWANPNIGPSDFYWLLVVRVGTMDRIYVKQHSTGTARYLNIETPMGGDWQNTVYQGGYAIILNNGIIRPKYILDTTGNTSISNLAMYDLPGWDSYHANEIAVNDTYDELIHVAEFDLGRLVDFTKESVVVNIVRPDGSRKTPITFTKKETIARPGTNPENPAYGTLAEDSRTNSHTISLDITGNPNYTPPAMGTTPDDNDPVPPYLETGDIVLASIRTLDIVQVRAKVIRSWGDVLVAGGLIEVDNTDPTIVLRNQPGVVRISDVAAAGSIPHNWNPYSAGVSTAEEFTLSTTGIVTELAELQGNLYIYTTNSIHALNKTGNPSVPYVANTVSNQYGALSRDCVQEFNGKHIVVGSNDIYEFSGHPASINSIAVNRVQDFFYEDLSATNIDDTYMLLHRAANELWINYRDTSGNTKVLVWDYKHNVFSIRQTNMGIQYGVIAPYITASSVVDQSRLRPTFCTSTEIFGSDYEDTYTDSSGNPYNSYFERIQGALTPEFDVESIGSVAVWAEGEGTLNLLFRPTNNPGQLVADPVLMDTPLGPYHGTFEIGDDYKSDVRLNGRFLNYRITDAMPGNSTTTKWNVSGLQLAVMKGGRR